VPLILTKILDGDVVSLMSPVALPTWKQSLHPLSRRPGGLQGMSGRLEKKKSLLLAETSNLRSWVVKSKR